MTNLVKSFRKLLAASVFVSVSVFSASAFAEVPKVTASIKPIHSWVATVMEGVGTPELIVKGTGSEHGYSLRPSDADNLAKADIVFWAGPSMETFLIKPLDNLAEKADKVALSEIPGIKLIDMREGGMFEAHSHDHDHDHEHEHGEADHDHDKAEKADAHDHDHAHEHANEHESAEADHDHDHHKDLHFWLDPENAKVAVKDIAEVLAKKDPEHADRYRQNATAYVAKLDTLIKQVNSELAPVRGKPFIVFHDGYHYFEKRFGIPAAGSITVNPEQAPGAQRISEIKEKVKDLKSACIFSEPQFEPRVVKTIQEGTGVKTGELDPLGYDIPEGPMQYELMIEKIAHSLKHCLSE
ncbi:zinc ABC transporter substrate-binding protein [Bartonella sp. HY038]|uniref:zinc ABC transporter substrate-binding protein n=1 Tax=Bartonella sp. HY038 TaxID=2759660 RepID=UPI0015FD64A5|nr:zinc ABC transporter substrate-binding protein [Bartonella sp. HY038]